MPHTPQDYLVFGCLLLGFFALRSAWMRTR